MCLLFIYSQNNIKNCFIGLTITRYDRNYDQNEELGLNDLKIDNYWTDYEWKFNVTVQIYMVNYSFYNTAFNC